MGGPITSVTWGIPVAANRSNTGLLSRSTVSKLNNPREMLNLVAPGAMHTGAGANGVRRDAALGCVKRGTLRFARYAVLCAYCAQYSNKFRVFNAVCMFERPLCTKSGVLREIFFAFCSSFNRCGAKVQDDQLTKCRVPPCKVVKWSSDGERVSNIHKINHLSFGRD
jgi:hypothetical protein